MKRYKRHTKNRDYRKPALAECVIYVRFTPDEFDLVNLPKMMLAPLTSATLLEEPASDTKTFSLNRASAMGAKVRLENKERTFTAQYGPGLLTLHASQPYSGFQKFLEQSLPIIRQIAEVHEDFGFTELSLAYLDTFDLEDDKPLQLFKLFNYGLHLPSLPFQKEMAVREFEVSTQFELEELRRVLSLDLEGGSNGVGLFSSCEAKEDALPNLSSLEEWLTDSHEILVDLFESVITDETRDFMEVVHA